MIRLFSKFYLCILICLVADSALAGVAVQMVITGPGTFAVLIDANSGGNSDNSGFVSYGLQLEGPIMSVDHKSPQTAFAQDASFVGGPAGFTLNRSPNNDLFVTASQDTNAPTPHLIQGFGVVASSFVGEGLNSLAPPEQPVWWAPLLIASGTFDESQGAPGIDVSSGNLFFTAFCHGGIRRLNNYGLCVPEPRSSVLMVLGLVSLVSSRVNVHTAQWASSEMTKRGFLVFSF